MMDDSMWGMILGKSGKIPGTIDPILVELPRSRAVSSRLLTLIHCFLTHLMISRKKWTRMDGIMVRMTRNYLNLLCIQSSIATIRADRLRRISLQTFRLQKTLKLGAKVSPEEAAAFKHAKADAIVAPVKGQIFWEFQGEGEAAPAVEPFIGKEYKEGDVFCYIQASWGEFVAVPADLGGKLVEINAKQGSKVGKGDVIAYIEREKNN
jgi:pyruvate carboxylase subunit B